MITLFQRIIHRQLRWIFLIFLGLFLVGFLLMDYWGVSKWKSGEKIKESKIVFGKKISPREIKIARRLNLLLMRGQDTQISGPYDQLLEEQTVRQIVMAEKAHQMGMTVSDEEFDAEFNRTVSRLRPLFREATSDQEAYIRFVSEMLVPRRIEEEDFKKLVDRNILQRKLSSFVYSTAKITPQELQTATSKSLEKLRISVCRFEANDFSAQIKPTEKELTDYHLDHPDLFRTPRKIRVSYVSFPLETLKVTEQEIQKTYDTYREQLKQADGKMTPLKDVAELLRKEVGGRKAKEQAEEFAVKLVPEDGKSVPSFEVLAKEHGLKVQQTKFFTEDEQIPGIAGMDFTKTAFQLSSEIPVVDPVMTEEFVYVLHLLEEQPSSLPPYEPIKSSVKKAYVTEISSKLALENGEKKRKELADLLKEKKSFESAAKILKLKSQINKSFTEDEALPSDPFEKSLRQTSLPLSTGDLSDFVPYEKGGFFIYVISREPPQPEEITKAEPRIRQKLLQTLQKNLWQDFQQSVMTEALGSQP